MSIFGVSRKGGWRTFLSALGVVTVSLVFAGVSWGGSYDPALDSYSMYNLTAQMGAPAWWDAGYTGQGVDVAVIDTGVAPVQGLNSPGQVVYGPDLSLESQNPSLTNLDTNGHGTFMAGLIAGHDPSLTAPYSSAPATAYRGIAPDARIVSLKVANADGGVDVTQVIAAIDWVVQHAHDPGFNIRVINLSYGTLSSQPYQADPLAYAAEQAWKHGIVVVAAAGNTGAAPGNGRGLSDPAYDPYVIAAGAYNTMGTNKLKDDVVASYSARSNGCRGCKNPDLVAPGTHMQGLRVPGGYIDQNNPGGVIDGRYFRGSGTSEAAAITSGVVALLLQKYPDLTPDEVKYMLTDSAQKIPGWDGHFQGAGALSLTQLATEKDPNGPGPGCGPGPGPHGGGPGGCDVQHFPGPDANGSGSLEDSRGGDLLSRNGVVLSGNQDIFGNPVDPNALAQAEADGSSWSGGAWNGSTWTGSSWSGSSWSGSSWSGSSWSGSSWSGSSWSGSSWSGNSWSGSSWSGSSWSGSSWSGDAWSGDVWAGVGWS
ncbi:MAG TPA: S8 family serine peptidase [Gaiellaceae bacterium]|nr:S8 family serine peptidase [Gaiellaceae bacterium]